MKDVEPVYSSIAELAARLGTVVPCAGNLPVKLDDPDSIWFIDRGAVNLFLVEYKDGEEQAESSGCSLEALARSILDQAAHAPVPPTRFPHDLIALVDPGEDLDSFVREHDQPQRAIRRHAG